MCTPCGSNRLLHISSLSCMMRIINDLIHPCELLTAALNLLPSSLTLCMRSATASCVPLSTPFIHLAPSWTFLHRIINTVISGSGSLLTGFLYSNITCFDGEVLLKRRDKKFRALVTMKCFICGKHFCRLLLAS